MGELRRCAVRACVKIREVNCYFLRIVVPLRPVRQTAVIRTQLLRQILGVCVRCSDERELIRYYEETIVLAAIGLVILGLLYKFRHPIEHFRLHIRFRTLEVINISPSSSTMPKGSRKKLIAIAHYRDGSQAELVSE